MVWNEPKEKAITDSIIKWLNKTYQPEGYAWKIHGGEYSKSGMPDVAFLYRGRMAFFEVKRPSNPNQEGSDLQKQKMRILEFAGAPCFIVNSKQAVINLVEGGGANV